MARPKERMKSLAPHDSPAFIEKCVKEKERLQAQVAERLKEDILTLLTDKLHPDLTVVSGTECITAHSVMIYARAGNYFNIPDHFITTEDRVLTLSGLHGQSAEVFLKQLYILENVDVLLEEYNENVTKSKPDEKKSIMVTSSYSANTGHSEGDYEDLVKNSLQIQNHDVTVVNLDGKSSAVCDRTVEMSSSSLHNDASSILTLSSSDDCLHGITQNISVNNRADMSSVCATLNSNETLSSSDDCLHGISQNISANNRADMSSVCATLNSNEIKLHHSTDGHFVKCKLPDFDHNLTKNCHSELLVENLEEFESRSTLADVVVDNVKTDVVCATSNCLLDTSSSDHFADKSMMHNTHMNYDHTEINKQCNRHDGRDRQNINKHNGTKKHNDIDNHNIDKHNDTKKHNTDKNTIAARHKDPGRCNGSCNGSCDGKELVEAYEACSNLGQHLLSVYLEEWGSDQEIVVCGQTFNTHRCILAARSQYFAAMFGGSWRESGNTCIKLEGISPAVFEQALLYLYGGVIEIGNTCSLSELLLIADMYGIEGLKDVVCYHLRKEYCHFFHKPCSACTTSLAEALILSVSYQLDEVKDRCLKSLGRFFTKFWATKAFSGLPDDVLQLCCDYIASQMTEKTVIETILDCHKLSSSLPRVKWAEPILHWTNKLLELAIEYTSEHFVKVVGSEQFLSWGKRAAWSGGFLEEIFRTVIDSLPTGKACGSYRALLRLHDFNTSQEDQIYGEDVTYLLESLISHCETYMKIYIHQVTQTAEWALLPEDIKANILKSSSYVCIDRQTKGRGASPKLPSSRKSKVSADVIQALREDNSFRQKRTMLDKTRKVSEKSPNKTIPVASRLNVTSQKEKHLNTKSRIPSSSNHSSESRESRNVKKKHEANPISLQKDMRNTTVHLTSEETENQTTKLNSSHCDSSSARIGSPSVGDDTLSLASHKLTSQTATTDSTSYELEMNPLADHRGGSSSSAIISTSTGSSPNVTSTSTRSSPNVVSTSTASSPNVVSTSTGSSPNVTSTSTRSRPNVVSTSTASSPNVVSTSTESSPNVVSTSTASSPNVTSTSTRSSPNVVSTSTASSPNVTSTSTRSSPNVVSTRSSSSAVTSTSTRSSPNAVSTSTSLRHAQSTGSLASQCFGVVAGNRSMSTENIDVDAWGFTRKPFSGHSLETLVPILETTFYKPCDLGEF